jgi:PIN domain nuclease of toxin-antitoxin system
MDSARHHFAMSGSVASEFVSHQSPGRLALLLKKPAKEAGSGFPVSSCLDEDIQDLAILIHGSIQIAKLSADTHEDPIDKPLIAAGTGSLAQAVGIDRAESNTPSPDALV